MRLAWGIAGETDEEVHAVIAELGDAARKEMAGGIIAANHFLNALQTVTLKTMHRLLLAGGVDPDADDEPESQP